MELLRVIPSKFVNKVQYSNKLLNYIIGRKAN